MTNLCRQCRQPIDQRTRKAGGEVCFDCATWRGPFRVASAGRGAWKIINHRNDTERTGYRAKATADLECDLMNRAKETDSTDG